MQKRITVIDFSATKIHIGIVGNCEHNQKHRENQVDISPEIFKIDLPWEIGFRQEIDGTLSPCFGEALTNLDSNSAEEVQFTELDVYLKEITDTQTLDCLFYAFFQEIFHNRLPEHGYPMETTSVCVITPYQWNPTHREQLRLALKRVSEDSSNFRINRPNVTLRCLLSQILCLTVYYRKMWENILSAASKIHLFLIDFARYDLTLHRLVCKQTEDRLTVELCDLLRFSTLSMDTDKLISDVHETINTVGKTVPVVAGFSGRCSNMNGEIGMLLRAQETVIFLEPRETAALLGGVELAKQLSAETDNIEKLLHFIYHFCFGVRLPDGDWIELLPKTAVPPCSCKKAFRVTGTAKKFNIHLFCGLSLTDKSDVHRLATLEIHTKNRRTRDFVLSVILDTPTQGNFSVHLPDERTSQGAEFRVPALMD